MNIWWLCPDCFYLHARSLKNSPARAQLPSTPTALAEHMGSLASAVGPGAGVERRQAPSFRTSVSAARAHVLWYLQSRSWVSVARASRAFLEAVDRTHRLRWSIVERCQRNYASAVAGLRRDGRVWVFGTGRRQAMRAVRGELEMPQVASARRPRRRRRDAGPEAAEPRATQRARLQ